MKIVVDANVYVSAQLSPKGVCARVIKLFTSRESSFQLVATKKIYAEVLDVLTRPKIIKFTKKFPPEVELVMEQYEHIATMVPDIAIPKADCRDPKDLMYLAASYCSNAEILVSGDKDLLVIGEYRGAQIMRPDEFLSLAQQV